MLCAYYFVNISVSTFNEQRARYLLSIGGGSIMYKNIKNYKTDKFFYEIKRIKVF